MKVATAQTMREIDNYSINTIGIPSTVLMENAALKVVKHIKNNYKKVCIVCNIGNNGGDGFAVARHLFNNGQAVEVFLIGQIEGMTNDCRINYIAAKNIGVEIKNINSKEELEALGQSVISSDIVVDGIFGTGLTRDVKGIYLEAINIINNNKKYTLSIDVPSGMNSDTGKVMANCIKADKTISFQLYKKGLLSIGAEEYTGTIIIEDIGIPKIVVDKFHEGYYFLDQGMVKEFLKERNKYSHKGDFGRVLIIAGSKGYSGAAYLTTEAAVSSGAGLVTLCCPPDIRDLMCSKLTEAMTCSLDEEDKLLELIKKADSIAIGPGMGNTKETLEVLKKVIHNGNCPIVIDADGINVLKDNIDILKDSNSELVLTPHPGEFSRIADLSIDYINNNRMECAKEFALDHKITLLLKGFNTIITDGKELYINSTGNSSMASGGMGDCLTGVIAALIAQGYKPLIAAFLGAYIHGYAGEKLSHHMNSVKASSVVEYLPHGMKELLES